MKAGGREPKGDKKRKVKGRCGYKEKKQECEDGKMKSDR